MGYELKTKGDCNVRTGSTVRNHTDCITDEDSKPLAGVTARDSGMRHKETVQAISDLFEGKLEGSVVKRRVPDVGEYILINECGGCFSRVHGGRYEINSSRRYFGRVTQRYPHIILMETGNGLTSEKVSDIKIGLVQYVSLKSLPEHPEELTYDERLLSNFIRDFENLLLE